MNGLGRALLANFVLVAAAIGCGTSVTGPDSETHWLRVCNADAECGAGLSCLCRTCTRACTSDGCSTLGAGAKCVTPSNSAACGASLDTAICTADCSRDADCASAGAGLRCLGGACLAGAGGGDAGVGSESGGAGTGGDVTASGGAGTGGDVTASGGAGTGGDVTASGGAGTGGDVTASGGEGTGGDVTASGGVPAACTRPLTQSGCAATYQDALAAIQCSPPGLRSNWLASCGDVRLVGDTVVDVATTCAYDASGVLVGGRTCSKTVLGCNCFVGGDVNFDACQAVATTDPCAVDAGKN